MENETKATDFLQHDFDECFQQMRYYDTQILDILKFMSTVYSIVAGIGVGLYERGVINGQDYSLPVSICIGILVFFGMFLLILIVRNRVYFVHVARYVNEVRNHFLASKPNGFENKSRMFTNYEQPQFFNWRSSQLFFIYLVATANSFLLGILLYVSTYNRLHSWLLIGITSVVILIIQVTGSVLYLKTRHSLSASRSVFGED